MAKLNFRVYFITHFDGRKTGIMMRNWSSWFDAPPPSAYGEDEQDVLQQLEVLLLEKDATGGDHMGRYLWKEEFELKSASVDIFPQSVIKKRPVIGKRRIPLRLSYAWSKMEGGAFRVMLPRFDWWFVLEDLSCAGEVLRGALTTALLGEEPRWIYDFRYEGEEYIREWSPDLLGRLYEPKEEHDHLLAEFPQLCQAADELVHQAAKHKLGRTWGGADELTPYHNYFRQHPPPSILLVGGPGVGKTTWVRKLARLMLQWKRDKSMTYPPRVWTTSKDRLISGMVYLGMWQERCLAIAEELAYEGDYLHVDRLSALLEPQPDGSSIAEVLTPYVLGEELSLIAEATESELEQCRRRAPSLVAAFKIIRLTEPAPKAVAPLLMQSGGDAKLSAQAMLRLLRHLESFQKDLCFPGKAFRFMDWLHKHPTKRKGLLEAPQISEAFAKYSGLPVALISDEHATGAAQIASQLSERVIGQTEACETCGRLLARFKAGLNDPEKPCGSLFFVGPTGVGKTELAKQLARYMFGAEDRLVRLDMSEYMNPGAAQRLLQAGPGRRALAEQIRNKPLSLVLFDEIEKAHPEVFDLLLGIMGEGRMTDALGRHVDFRMTLLVMTSNLGASSQPTIGFGAQQLQRYLSSVKTHFRPEFFARLDHVLGFDALQPEDIRRIVDLRLEKIEQREGLRRRNINLMVSAQAKAQLAESGYDRKYGARPLNRVMEEQLVTPLAVRMAQNPTLRNVKVPVLVEGDSQWSTLDSQERNHSLVLPNPKK